MRDNGYQSHVSPVATKAGLTLIHTPAANQKFGKRVYMGNYMIGDRDVFYLHMN